jgi:predicted AlkP superfamily phosphohydrolase/phosphomutase
MPARVIVIGVDAAEGTLLERWASEGKLPTFARLERYGCVRSLANCLETLPGAIWPEITTGISCGRMPRYYHRRQLHTGEARLRPILSDEVNPGNYYWTVASRAGCRVAVIDQVQTVSAPRLNGIQLFEWGLHDRNFRVASDPPELLEEVRKRYGDHPVIACDLHGETLSGYKRLFTNLLTGVEKKTAMLRNLLARESWDLFTCTYGESHCVGHQFWHFLDSQDRKHDPKAPADLNNAILSIYQRIDQGIGALIDEAGSQALVLVIASHGMGPYLGGPQLLPEVLVRLGMGSDNGTARSPWLRRFQIRVSHSPRSVQPLLARLARRSLVTRIQAKAGCLLDPLESPRTRAVALRNNRCGAIRVNLKGREPFGQVQPGDQAETLLSELRSELMALKDPKTAKYIITKVITAAEAFGAEHHPDVPDLMIVFRSDLGPLESCYSERVGLIEQPIYHPNIPRTGDHTAESRLWIMGPDISAGTSLPTANVLDIAPTILRMLDVPLPDDLDGRPLPIFQKQNGDLFRYPCGPWRE